MDLLLIDSQKEYGDTLARMLDEAGEEHSLIQKLSLAEAEEFLSEQRVDLILLSLALPESRGLDSLELFLESCGDFLPVVVLTKIDDLETAKTAIQTGAQDYLIKNEITPHLLLHTIHYALERHELLQEVREYRDSLESMFSDRTRELSRSRKMLLEAERLAGVGAWEYDLVKEQWSFSENWCNIHGTDKMTCTMAELLPIAHPDDAPTVECALKASMEQGVPYDLEHRIIHQKTGEVRHIQAFGEAGRNEAGEIVRVVGAALDITERKKVEAKLRDTLVELEMAQEIAMVGSWSFDPAVGVPEWSDAVYAIYEREKEQGPFSLEEYKEVFEGEHRESFFNHLQAAIRQGTPYDHVLKFTTPQGGSKWVRAICRPDSKPGPEGYFLRGTIQDITDRKEAEEELRRSEQRLKEAQRIGGIGDWEWRPETDTVTWSENMYRLFDLDPHKPVPDYQGQLDLYHPEDAGKLREAVTRALEQGMPYELEMRRTTPGGRELYFLIRGIPEQDKEGNVLRLYGSVLDITEQKKAEEALKESGRTYRLLADNTLDVIWLMDLELTFLYVNPAITDLVGYAPEEWIGTKLPEHCTPQVMEEMNVIIQQELDNVADHNGVIFETEMLHREGHSVPLEIRGKVLTDDQGRPIGLQGATRDITERKQAEKELMASEERYRRLFEDAVLGIFQSTPKGDILAVNPEFCRLFGYASQAEFRDEVTDMTELYADPNQRPDIVRHILESKGPYRKEISFRRKDSSEFTGMLHSWSVRDSDNTKVYLEGLLEDITERKHNEELIRKQNQRNRLLNQITLATSERQDLDSVFHVVLSSLEEHLAIQHSAILFCNSQDQKLTVKAARAGKKEITPIFTKGTLYSLDLESRENNAPADLEKLLNVCEQPLWETLQQAGLEQAEIIPLVAESELTGFLVVVLQSNDYGQVEKEFLSQLANHLAQAIREKQLFQELQEAYQELQRNQEATLRQERIRALGQMASGIVHDINNAISPVMGYTELIMESGINLGEESLQKYLGYIRMAAVDVTHIITQMREFYRNREEQEQLLPADLNKLVEEVLELTKARWRDIPQKEGRLVIMDRELQEDLPVVNGVESEIREAQTNLIINAVDALDKEGVILVRTWEEDGQAVVSVRDNGMGMDEETVQRCLEPFYSKKGEKGTGMGLSMVYGIMKRHGGEIRVDSTLGKGTEVQLLFPAQKEEAEKRKPAAPAERPPAMRILCIDDKASIRKLLSNMLKVDGHRVQVAEGGGQGIEAVREAADAGSPFDVVITDLGMPFVDGREVANELKAAYPDLPVILLTGWGGRLQDEGTCPEDVDSILNKPPRIAGLRNALLQVSKKSGTGTDPEK